ncbi:MAG: 6-bladed beta-propeller [candidate division KSB1 bacterium]|nr:6-bladed beta-propeller [candidate division KSB1 bacterium]MDQ7064661.1 6-bladed beta-propeller [candidate division KSB1 bacterium]
MKQILISIYVFSLFAGCRNDQNLEDRLIRRAGYENTHALLKIDEIRLQENKNNIIGIITSMQISSKGEIFINDVSSAKIHVYSQSGKFLRSIGSFGQGPGEFERNVEIRLSSNKLGVLDVGLKRISFFTMDGKYLNLINLAEDPETLFIMGRFDFSPNERRIYVEGISKKVEPDEICDKSFILVAYNSRLRPVTRGGEFDPFARKFCHQHNKKSFVRVDSSGNIYVLPYMVPRVTVYSPRFERLKRINFYNEYWKLPFSESNPFDYTNPQIAHSRVLGMEIGKITGNLFIHHGWKDYEKSTRGNEIIHFYLTVIDSKGNFLIGGHSLQVPGPITIDHDENIYFLLEDTPGNRIIGKFKIIKRIAD